MRECSFSDIGANWQLGPLQKVQLIAVIIGKSLNVLNNYRCNVDYTIKQNSASWKPHNLKTEKKTIQKSPHPLNCRIGPKSWLQPVENIWEIMLECWMPLMHNMIQLTDDEVWQFGIISSPLSIAQQFTKGVFVFSRWLEEKINY